MPPDDPPLGLGDEIQKLANAVRALHHTERRGELAALRRMAPERVEEPAFYRILATVAPEASLNQARRIALVVKILALATSAEMLTRGRNELGAALAKAEFSESRVQMLMTARDDALDNLLVRAARRLVHDGVLPYDDIARLVLGGEMTRETVRFRVAKSYWAATAREADDPPPALQDPS